MSAIWREGLRPVALIARGENPFDQAVVEKSFANMSEIAKKLPPLWPPNSVSNNPEARYSSSPKVWENKKDFDAQLAKLPSVIAANREKAMSGPEGAKAAFKTVDDTCNACHDVYRLRIR